MNRKDILKMVKNIIIKKQKTTSEQIISSNSNADEEACPSIDIEHKKIIS